MPAIVIIENGEEKRPVARRVTVFSIHHFEAKSLQEELGQDMLSILTVFLAKLYGSRSREFRKRVRFRRL
ncbi:MAG: hypothetical protein IMX05_04315 [Hydrogenibacillus schlegelii]|nr:hypothetical protein [Hydrogenibacillus schlegelii]